MNFKFSGSSFQLTLPHAPWQRFASVFNRQSTNIVLALSVLFSWISWFYYFSNGNNLAYNDAMSHLDIARRVYDNLTPGAAQLGSVWLPLSHVLMLPTIWIDFFWRSGFSAAIVSMIAYSITVVAIFKTSKSLGLSTKASLIAAAVTGLNTNFLYLQTTALTEPLFMACASMSLYYLAVWVKSNQLYSLIGAAFWIMLSSLTRYDGWALLGLSGICVVVISYLRTKKYKVLEGNAILFGTLAGLGIVLWLGWNYMIFGNPLYFATGEFSAKAQQDILEAANDLPTKHNLWISFITYVYAMISNIGLISIVIACFGWILFLKQKLATYKVLALAFAAPLIFNILALYLGHSVIHLPELFGASWFNVRYGLIVLPWVAIGVAYVFEQKSVLAKSLVPYLLFLQIGMFFNNRYIVTVDDGLWGSSQKNVKQVGLFINEKIGPTNQPILVSVASHDAILFQSGLPMKRFIHEGTGDFWDEALIDPDQFAPYVLMRTHDNLDSVAREMDKVPGFFERYELLYDDEYADVYQRKLPDSITMSEAGDNEAN